MGISKWRTGVKPATNLNCITKMKHNVFNNKAARIWKHNVYAANIMLSRPVHF